MASKRRKKRQRKKIGFSAHTPADAKPHRDFVLALKRSKPSYQRQLALEREDH